ncbi:Sec7-like domain is implicated in guanine nucleotide exchange function [Cyathus striatus]|nr:Sec7-like domain is implicated in guanine nucleotide exchange function [Cyathus striatus]
MTSSPITQHSKSVSPKHVLLSGIFSVTSAMRKNSRWSSLPFYMAPKDYSSLGTNMGLRISSPSQVARPVGRTSKEVELMLGFIQLKRSVSDMEDVSQTELPSILAPFFAILRSPLSTGPITSAALTALHNFFLGGLILPTSLRLSAALSELSNTVSQCKFEASDSSGDEVVLLKIMAVIQDCLCGPVGRSLGDVEVCEVLEAVLTTCCQMRLSEILRRSAENTMHALVRTVFGTLRTLDPEVEEAKLNVNGVDDNEGELKMSVQSALISNDESGRASSDNGSQQLTEERKEPPDAPAVPTSHLEYGLPSILELLRVLFNVLDPSDQQHTDSTRLVALGILNAAFEEAGSSISLFPSLKTLVVDTGCKFLFQLARSENLSVLQSALHTISTIFVTMRKHLKLQHELFLAFSIDRLALPVSTTANKSQISTSAAVQRPGTPAGSHNISLEDRVSSPSSKVIAPPARGETRDLILETLGNISGYPSFMVDLYANYDCNVNCENIFERLVDFLTKNIQPATHISSQDPQQKNAQYLCLELLLSFVNDMASRANGDYEYWPSVYPTVQSLLQTKSQKQLVLTGAARFNSKPKSGIAFLEENRLIYTDLSPDISKAQSLAQFLKNCPRIDKTLLGDFISKPDNIEVLKAFIGLFDFKGKPVADAMRELLESFRLPGESQQIARITETFASIYFASDPVEIKNEDAVYVLAYSVIMLNTDLHNPQVRKRMSLEDYQKNLRGVNGGSDFSPEFLQNIYESIRKKEIVMPEEHTGQLGFEYAWKELLLRSKQSGEYMMCNSSLFDIEMFKTVWKPTISAIAHAFISFDDDYIIQKAIVGFRQCATLAGHFQLRDVFDFVVVSLSQATSLLSDAVPAHIPNYLVIDIEGQSVTISKLSVEFGRNFKGQLAAVVLFNIVNGNGNALREGWTQIFEMFQNLFLHSLLPIRMLQMEDFLGGVTMIPLRGNQPNSVPVRNDGGLLSTLSSYLITPYSSTDDVSDATEADIENTLCSIDCIASCRLDEFYSQIIQLEPDALAAAVRALEALAHERTVARLKLQSDDTEPSGSSSYQLPYDPAPVFLLETMVSISCQAPAYIEDLWPIVFEHLSALLSTSSQYSALLIERAVVSLLRLCRILAKNPSLRDQIYVSFDLLAGLPPPIASSVSEQIVAGVKLIAEQHREIISSQTEWNLVVALLRTTVPHPEASKSAYSLISLVILDGPEQNVSPDNFPGLLTLLDDFATLASSLTENQRHKGRRAEPLTSSKFFPFVERGKKSIDLVAHLHRVLLRWNAVTLARSQIWRQLALPLLMTLSRQSTNSAREIRHSAISYLQRILLGPNILPVEIDHSHVEDIFNRVIFPLLDELLKPHVYQRDPHGIPESRLRASALLCKVFMHLEARENNVKSDFRLLWIQILDLLDRLMNIDQDDQLYEAIPESLKNILLVMNAIGILVPPTTGEDLREERQKTLWTATQERMERFLPGFLTEVIPNQMVSTNRQEVS